MDRSRESIRHASSIIFPRGTLDTPAVHHETRASAWKLNTLGGSGGGVGSTRGSVIEEGRDHQIGRSDDHFIGDRV